MRVRAIKDLCQLADKQLFEAVAEGLGLILGNAHRLYEDSEKLAREGRGRGYQVLRAIAEEECAKFLMLIDAIRCPRVPPDRWSNHLDRFYDHLARGLYSWAYSCRPATFGQLQEYVDLKRQAYYLAGPNDVDWIFRNDIKQRREETLYVDYVGTDEGHQWIHPACYDWDGCILPIGVPLPCLWVCKALADAGCSSLEALAALANFWREVPVNRNLGWTEILEANRKSLIELENRGLLRKQPQEVYEVIIDRWQFPMYDIDLSKIPVSKEALRDRQRNWVP